MPLTEAIHVSAQRTDGHKLQMFGADVLVVVGVYVVVLVVGLLCALFAMIPVLGVLIVLALVLAVLAMFLLLPLFYGLVQTAFYEEIGKDN